MNHKTLKSLIQIRIAELERLYDCVEPDPERIVAKERDVVHEVADAMALAGFARLHKAGVNLNASDGLEAAKTFLSRCLGALRTKRPAGARSEVSAPMSVKEAAIRLNVSAQRVYRLCAAGQLRCVKIGRTIRIMPEEIAQFLAKQAEVPKPEPPPGEYTFLKLNSANQPSPSPRRRRGSHHAS